VSSNLLAAGKKIKYFHPAGCYPLSDNYNSWEIYPGRDEPRVGEEAAGRGDCIVDPALSGSVPKPCTH
jgi:hypothetical protein